MSALLGTSLPVFIGLTVVLMGFAAFMTGMAIANTWRPAWQVLFYGLLLGLADRFFVYALFDGVLLSVSGFVIDTAVLIAIGRVGFLMTRARLMVEQYPWEYERAGLFGWRKKPERREEV